MGLSIVQEFRFPPLHQPPRWGTRVVWLVGLAGWLVWLVWLGWLAGLAGMGRAGMGWRRDLGFSLAAVPCDGGMVVGKVAACVNHAPYVRPQKRQRIYRRSVVPTHLLCEIAVPNEDAAGAKRR